MSIEKVGSWCLGRRNLVNLGKKSDSVVDGLILGYAKRISRKVVSGRFAHSRVGFWSVSEMITEDIAGILLFIGVMGLIDPRLAFGGFFGIGLAVLLGWTPL